MGKRTVTVLAVAAALATSGCATAFTSTPESIGTADATFPGKVVSDTGGQVEYWAQFGTTTAYGSETAHQTVNVAKNALVTVHVQIAGLQRSTVYHYRLCAQDSQQKGGPGCGEDKQLITQTYGCGETVTTSFTLTGNLNCPQEAGFVVGANGIAINLAGHYMNGGISVGGGGPIGIDNTGGYDDVTIRNGTVDLFGTGISTAGASRNRILDITANSAGDAVDLDGGTDNAIRRGALFGRSFGVRSSGSNGLVVADTKLTGIFGDGLNLTGDRARIVRDDFVRNFGTGFPVGSGLRLVGSEARIADNHVNGDWSDGGLVVTGANNALVDNEVFDATRPDVPDPPPEWGDGIFVGAFSTGVVLSGNRVERNGGDGVDVRATGTKLDTNAAFDNGGWGILAVPGVVDLGGNTAGGNGAGQCQNVFCP